MLVLERKKHGVVFRTIWYAEDKLEKPGINRYRYAKFQGEKSSQKMRTLISDLTESEEDLLSHMSRSGKYKIRRAAKEGVVCDVISGEQLTSEQINEFAHFLCEFWKSKGMGKHNAEHYVKEIEPYLKKGAFTLSMARLGEKVLVYHTYIVGDDFARLFHSASHYRNDETVPYQLVGRANCLLHKEDMFAFKNQGKKNYDWGGAGEGEDVAGITRFKESFGGKLAEFYDFETIIGFRARIIKGLICILERF